MDYQNQLSEADQPGVSPYGVGWHVTGPSAVRSRRFVSWYICIGPIAKIAQCGFAGAAGVDRGPYIKEAAKYVVMYA